MTLTLPVKIIAGCWLCFLLIWFLLAFTNKRAERRAAFWQLLSYALPMIVGISLIARPQALRMNRLLYGYGWHGLPALEWLGALLALGGLALAVWARLTLGRNWSGTVQLKQAHELVTHGPYARIRHPIYTAISLLLLAIIMLDLTLGRVIGFAFAVLSFWIKLRYEEAVMLAQFPDAYSAYMACTRRLIPFLL